MKTNPIDRTARKLRVDHVFRIVVALGCGGWAVFNPSGHAALLAYDPFNYGDPADASAGEYAVGDEGTGIDVLGGQNPTIGPTPFYNGGWIQSGGDSQVVKAVSSLSYPQFAPGTGGLVQDAVQFECCSFGRSGREIAGGLGGGRDPRTIYQSFLIDFGTQGTDDPTQFGKRAHELWNGGIGDSFIAVDLFLNHFSGVNELSLQVTTDSGSTMVPVAGGGLDLDALAGTHLVVMRYEFDPSNPDSVTVYLDPTGSDESLETPDAFIAVPNSDLLITHHGTMTQFTFSGGGHVPGAFDEVRWGDTFADVTPFVDGPGRVPEGGSGLVLLSVVLGGLAAARRRGAPDARPRNA